MLPSPASPSRKSMAAQPQVKKRPCHCGPTLSSRHPWHCVELSHGPPCLSGPCAERAPVHTPRSARHASIRAGASLRSAYRRQWSEAAATPTTHAGDQDAMRNMRCVFLVYIGCADQRKAAVVGGGVVVDVGLQFCTVGLRNQSAVPSQTCDAARARPRASHHGHRRLPPRLGLDAVLAAWLAPWLAAEAVRRFGTVAVGHCISVVRRAAVGAHADRLLGGDRQHNPASHDAGRPDPRWSACNDPPPLAHLHWSACMHHGPRCIGPPAYSPCTP